MGSSMRALTLAVLVTVVFVSYQNCGRIGFEAQRGTLSGVYGAGSAACEGVLKQVYQSTYFPLLSSSCNRCHSNAHGSTDLDISYGSFASKGVSTIDYKATHPHGDNGLNLTSEIAALKPRWEIGQTDYASCMANAANENSGKLKLMDKIISSIDATKTDNTWKTVEWDLESEVAESQMGRVPAMFKMEARYEMSGTNVAGVNFRNPSLKLKATGKILQVYGLKIFLDSQAQPGSTTFNDVTSDISTTTYTLIAPQNSVAFVSYPLFAGTTLVAFEFQTAHVVDPSTVPTTTTTTTVPNLPPISFTQLTGNDPNLSIFKNRCASCHTGAGAPKGLDLTNYTVSAQAAATIRTRMNDSANPMPPTGLIPQAERDIVNRWINSGTPQ